MEGLKKFTENLNDIFMLFGGISLILMMAIACANMVLRLAGQPMSAAYELVGFLGKKNTRAFIFFKSVPHASF